MVEDYERGSSDQIQPRPWQTDTCIGSWHYDRARFDHHTYKTVAQVAQMLVNIVSKNGNLLLNIPVRGDGTIDEDEIKFLQGLGDWMAVNGEGIFGSRPWKVYGEGPAHVAGGMFNENKVTFGAQDIRFTTKGGALYAYFLGLAGGWQGDDPCAGGRRGARRETSPASFRCSSTGLNPFGCWARRTRSPGPRMMMGWMSTQPSPAVRSAVARGALFV